MLRTAGEDRFVLPETLYSYLRDLMKTHFTGGSCPSICYDCHTYIPTAILPSGAAPRSISAEPMQSCIVDPELHTLGQELFGRDSGRYRQSPGPVRPTPLPVAAAPLVSVLRLIG